jgi:hypothetical protein
VTSNLKGSETAPEHREEVVTFFGQANVRRVCALVQLVVFLPACFSWRVQSAAPAELLGTQHPTSVRVTAHDRSHLTLNNPEIRGDTLYGTPDRVVTDTAAQRVGIPLANVREIAVRRSDPTRNTLLIVGIGVATFSILCFGADAFGCGPEEVFLTAASPF